MARNRARNGRPHPGDGRALKCRFHFPQVSGREVVKVLEKIGYRVVRTKGSHIMMRGGSGTGVTVPDHRTVAPGTLRAILRAVGLTVDEFVAHLKG